MKLLDSYVVVAVGPFASAFWRRESAGRDNNHHTQGFCAFCNEFCLHATCEHMHAAFLALGQLSVQRPIFPKRSQPVPLFEQPPVEVVLSSALTEHSGHSKPRPDPLALPQENAAISTGSPVDFLEFACAAAACSVSQTCALLYPVFPLESCATCKMLQNPGCNVRRACHMSRHCLLRLPSVHFAGPSCR